MVKGQEHESTGCSGSIAKRKEPPTVSSPCHDCNFQSSLPKDRNREPYVYICFQTCIFQFTFTVFPVCHQVLFCKQECFVFVFLVFVLLLDVVVGFYLNHSVGSFNQGNMMLYVHVIWFCFSVSRATLEVLITLRLVILALILFCGLSQGLGPLYLFIFL